MNLLEAIAKALKDYKTDYEADDNEFADVEVNEQDREVLVTINGQPVAITVEEF